MSVALLKPFLEGELYLVSIISTFFFNLGILWIDTQNLALTFSAIETLLHCEDIS